MVAVKYTSMANTSERRFERIGHRGIPALTRENTLEGFTLALDSGADAVELDTHVSADGVVVVHHDETVGGSPIAAMKWQDLESVDLGGNSRLPTLDQVLQAAAGRATVYVELKGVGIEQQVIGVVRKHQTAVALHSFDHSAIERAARAAPEIPRGILLENGVTNPIQAMRRAVDRTSARDVWPHWSLVGSDFMRAADDLAVRVVVWTVNTADRARHLASLGVAGVCTDDVRLLTNL
jgi:glycerophosphoryl diester phosphodiesterase